MGKQTDDADGIFETVKANSITAAGSSVQITEPILKNNFHQIRFLVQHTGDEDNYLKFCKSTLYFNL